MLAFGCLYLRIDKAPVLGSPAADVLHRATRQTFNIYYAAAFRATLCAIGPPAALSGAALPLIFDAVREEMGDLGAKAGRLYSQNTIGSLLGALVGGYALLFWLDLHHVFRVALSAFALAAALVTARRYLPARAGRRSRRCSRLRSACWYCCRRGTPGRLAAGFFRAARAASPGRIVGPRRGAAAFKTCSSTTTIRLRRSTAMKSSPEARLDHRERKVRRQHPSRDLHTMALAALLPALFADRTESAFVIGFGTGITAGYLAELAGMRSVTVAEISSGVLGAAPLFDFANNGASHHPKIEHVRSDAYRALLRSGERFDVIVSEPSNPWVAGIEMLFSREFLRAARDRLEPGGVYVQWYHLYENNDRSVAARAAELTPRCSTR